MAVALAGVDLVAVSVLRAAEDRHVVRHHMPGFEGDVLQDLGRGPSQFVIDGILQGDQAQSDAESLRGAFRGGSPVEFVAALATTLEVQQVMIRSLELHEQSGWPALIHIRAVVVEYIEPPAPAAIGLGGSLGLGDVSLAGAADGWNSALGQNLNVESLSRQIINDPALANDLLAEAGSLREQVSLDVGARLSIDKGKLASFLANAAPGTDAGLFGAIAGALSGDPGALQGVFISISGTSLGPLLEQMQSGDIVGGLLGAASSLGGGQIGELIDTLSGDAGKFGEIVTTLIKDPAGAAALAAGALADLGVLPDVLASAPELLGNLDPKDIAGSLRQNLENLAGDVVKDVLSSVTGLDPAKAGEIINALRDADSLQDVLDIVADTGLDWLDGASELRETYEAAEALLQSGNFIKKLRAVIASAKDVVRALQDFNPVADLQTLAEKLP
jgi:hypothetical protein